MVLIDQSITLRAGPIPHTPCRFPAERQRAIWKRSGNRRWQPVATAAPV